MTATSCGKAAMNGADELISSFCQTVRTCRPSAASSIDTETSSSASSIIKHCRAVVTRYDKRPENFLAGVKLASLRIRMRFNESMIEWRIESSACDVRYWLKAEQINQPQTTLRSNESWIQVFCFRRCGRVIPARSSPPSRRNAARSRWLSPLPRPGNRCLKTQAQVPRKIDPGVLRYLGDKRVHEGTPERLCIDCRDMCLGQNRTNEFDRRARIGKIVDHE